MARPVTKSAAAKKATGTARKDRPTIADAPAPPGAVDLSAPQSVREAALTPQWDTIIRDLAACGVITETDLIALEKALGQLANSETWKARLVSAWSDPEASVSDCTKIQGALNSSLGSYVSILTALERQVKLRPRTEKADEWET